VHLHLRSDTPILTVTACTSIPKNSLWTSGSNPELGQSTGYNYTLAWGRGWVLHVTGHERSLPIKQTGKQTLNLNVNESAEATSEPSRLLREQLHQPQNLLLPSPSCPPLCLITHWCLKRKKKEKKRKRKRKKTLILTLTPCFHLEMWLLNYLSAEQWSKVGKHRHTAHTT
jgi:hypothetical protein